MTITLKTLSITYTITNGPGNPRDWVGVFRIGDANNKYLDWKYLANNRQSPRPIMGVGNNQIDLRISNPSLGPYEIRFLSINNVNDYKVIEKSDPIQIGAFPTGIKFADPSGVRKESWELDVPTDSHIKVTP